MKIYLIGSLRNKNIPLLAQELRQQGHDVFDDWHSPGPECDDHWKQYEIARGRSFMQSLKSPHALHVFAFDKKHLSEADAVVLMCPAGKSGHLELGWMLGRGKPGFILLDKEDVRWDIMYNFATDVFDTKENLYAALSQYA